MASSVSDMQANQIAVVQRLADRWQCAIELKGPGYVVAAPGRLPCINPKGDTCLAAAGTGDISASLIGSYLAQLQDAFSESRVAVYRHGKVPGLWPASAEALAAHQLAQTL